MDGVQLFWDSYGNSLGSIQSFDRVYTHLHDRFLILPDLGVNVVFTLLSMVRFTFDRLCHRSRKFREGGVFG